MKALVRGLTLVEALVAVGVILVLAALMVPALRAAAQEKKKKICLANLAQIVKACTTYQEPNGDFFPVHSQYFAGTKDDFKPMPSLAILYPAHVDNPRIFGCPATKDKPFISRRQVQGAWWTCFGTDVPGQPAANPARYSGLELGTEMQLLLR